MSSMHKGLKLITKNIQYVRQLKSKINVVKVELAANWLINLFAGLVLINEIWLIYRQSIQIEWIKRQPQ